LAGKSYPERIQKSSNKRAKKFSFDILVSDYLTDEKTNEDESLVVTKLDRNHTALFASRLSVLSAVSNRKCSTCFFLCKDFFKNVI
jgi:hypothetical protein